MRTIKAADGLATFACVRYQTHQLIGVSVGLAGARLARADPVQTAAIAAAAFYGSWLPDADQLGSRIHRRSRLERRSLALGAFGAILRLPLVLFGVASRHRGISHSLVACAATTAITGVAVSLIDPGAGASVGIGVALGYGTHLLADACTPGGVRLFAPISRRRAWLLPAGLRIPTGSVRELGLAAIAISLASVLVVSWLG